MQYVYCFRSKTFTSPDPHYRIVASNTYLHPRKDEVQVSATRTKKTIDDIIDFAHAELVLTSKESFSYERKDTKNQRGITIRGNLMMVSIAVAPLKSRILQYTSSSAPDAPQ